MSVEGLAHLFIEVYTLDPVGIDTCVEPYVPEVFVSDFPCHFSRVPVPVSERDAVEIHSSAVYPEASVQCVRDVGEGNAHGGVVKSRPGTLYFQA